MKARDLRELGAEELAQKLRESARELSGLRLKNKGGNAEKPVRIRMLRRDVARMLTVAGQRESKS